jgi:iron complex transport system substrate-binding protein
MQQYMRWCIPILLSVALLLPATACTLTTDEVVSFPIEVTDQLDRVVRLEEVPERIISLSPGNTEILFALGLGDKIIGVTEYCNYPEAAQDIDKIGGFSTVDLERVVALEPDLILTASIHKGEVILALESMELTVFALDPKTLDEILESITLIGEITGAEEAASQLVTDMSNRIKAVTDETDNLPEAQRPRVFYITWHDPLRTAGGNTWHEELIAKGGGINIAHDLTGFPAISLETVVADNPQVIITGAGMGTGANLPLEFALTESKLEDVDARINNQVGAVPTDLSGRPGPRIVDALDLFAQCIHPEIFGEIE